MGRDGGSIPFFLQGRSFSYRQSAPRQVAYSHRGTHSNMKSSTNAVRPYPVLSNGLVLTHGRFQYYYFSTHSQLSVSFHFGISLRYNKLSPRNPKPPIHRVVSDEVSIVCPPRRNKFTIGTRVDDKSVLLVTLCSPIRALLSATLCFF